MSVAYTCPWCGTTYLTFQSNCSNCGGPMLAGGQRPNAAADEGELPDPPPAPRSISPRYVWRLLWSDAWFIVAFIFGILGTVFALVGAVLTAIVVTSFVGVPFLIYALSLLVFTIPVGIWRYRVAQRVLQVLREGEVTQGAITGTDEQSSVRVNGRHPWIVRYEFSVGGTSYNGKVTTLNPLGPSLAPGKAARILYLADAPRWNSIYPHP